MLRQSSPVTLLLIDTQASKVKLPLMSRLLLSGTRTQPLVGSPVKRSQASNGCACAAAAPSSAIATKAAASGRRRREARGEARANGWRDMEEAPLDVIQMLFRRHVIQVAIRCHSGAVGCDPGRRQDPGVHLGERRAAAGGPTPPATRGENRMPPSRASTGRAGATSGPLTRNTAQEPYNPGPASAGRRAALVSNATPLTEYPRMPKVAAPPALACAMIPAVLPAADAPAATANTNPLLAPWPGAYGGVPPFDKIKPDLFPAPLQTAPATPTPLPAPCPAASGAVPPFDKIKPDLFPAALETALAERRTEIAAIKNNPEPATFANTIEALEKAGATMARVGSMYGTWSGSLKDDAFAAVERDWSPKLSAANDEVLLDTALFARVQAVWDSPAKAKLTPEQSRLLWRTYNNFSRLGAKLGPKEKERLTAVNQELAGLYTAFGQKVLADEDSWIVLDSEADLAGLPQALVDGFKAAAEERKLEGKWVVVNTRSMVDPFLTYSSRRDLREKVGKGVKSGGDHRGG